jgi:hypothetical protein
MFSAIVGGDEEHNKALAKKERMGDDGEVLMSVVVR